MLIRLEMELEDVPGQLFKALEPISRYGGNIQSIMHQRERKTPLGRLPVMLIFEIGERARLNRILAALRAMGVRITRIGEREGAVRTTVLLIGHIIHTDVRDTIDRLNALKGVMVSDLSLAMGAPGQESAARMTIVVDDEKHTNLAISRMRRIADRKELLMITSLEAE
ncbi:MAG: ACT domain-containing protein [Hadesarchaea archaeon]|nr:ACT domain-containing protein [Hadesarchaea archaeon]MDH5685685.1 ACT domain-containing protein [Hadesarchaea archaeon]